MSERKAETQIGDVFHKWTVIDIAEPYVWGKSSYPQFMCQCECGEQKVVRESVLLGGHSRHCRTCSGFERVGIYPSAQFGCWTVLKHPTVDSRDRPNGKTYNYYYVEVQCKCGCVDTLMTSYLKKHPNVDACIKCRAVNKFEHAIGDIVGNWTVMSAPEMKHVADMDGNVVSSLYIEVKCPQQGHLQSLPYAGLSRATPCSVCVPRHTVQGKKRVYTKGLFKKSIVGLKVGKLSVVSFDHTENRRSYWLCQCECGNTLIKERSSITNTPTQIPSCGLCIDRTGSSSINWKGFGEISQKYWGDCVRGGDSRGLEFKLTIEEAWNLFLSQGRECALSGLPIKFKLNYKDDQTASLDRIDSSKGYTLNNVQWVHKDINRMKTDFTQEQIINYCNLIAKKHPATVLQQLTGLQSKEGSWYSYRFPLLVFRMYVLPVEESMSWFEETVPKYDPVCNVPLTLEQIRYGRLILDVDELVEIDLEMNKPLVVEVVDGSSGTNKHLSQPR